MAQLRDLLPLLREKCTGMLEQQAIDQLKKAYRNFCIESGYLQQTEVVTRNSDGSIDLIPEFDHYVNSVNALFETKHNRQLTKGVDYKVDSNNGVSVISGIDEVQVTFSIVPVLPMDDAIILDVNIVQRWSDEIAAGAASLLRVMPDQTWTDRNLADFYKRDFVKGHREAFQARVAANDELHFQPKSKRNFF